MAYILDEQLTFDTVVNLQKKMKDFIISTNENVISVDLSKVNQFDSAGLAFLLDAKKLCTKQGKLFKLCGMSEEAQSLADFCGIKEILIENKDVK